MSGDQMPSLPGEKSSNARGMRGGGGVVEALISLVHNNELLNGFFKNNKEMTDTFFGARIRWP